MRPRSPHCLTFAVQALAWSLTGHPWRSMSKLLMIIPGCYSRVSWVLSSELWWLSASIEDLYRRKLPARRYDSSVTAVDRVTPCSAATLAVARPRGGWGHCRRLAQAPAFMAHHSNG